MNSRVKRCITGIFSERRLRIWLLQLDRVRVSGTVVVLHQHTQLGMEGRNLEHPQLESNWIHAGYETHSTEEIKHAFLGTGGGSTFQYKSWGRSTNGFEGIKHTYQRADGMWSL